MIRIAEYVEAKLGLVNVIRILGVVVFVSFVLSSFTLWRQRDQLRETQTNLCHAQNAARVESRAHLRGPLRVALRRLGYQDLALEVTDLTLIDCSTGNPRP